MNRYVLDILSYAAYILVDITNIGINIYIIYALRKLKKLRNISYWFIFFLSVSDCLVGITGFTLDLSRLICHLRFICTSLRFLNYTIFFLISYSGRLTMIIAIDRSLRMKYLNKYKSMMTKRKANVLLCANGALGLIGLVTNEVVDVACHLFHLICIILSCTLYLLTYYKVKKKVAQLHSNMQSNGTSNRDITIVNQSKENRSVKAERRESTDLNDPISKNRACQSAVCCRYEDGTRYIGINGILQQSACSHERATDLNVTYKLSIEDNERMNEKQIRCVDGSNANDAAQLQVASESAAGSHLRVVARGNLAHFTNDMLTVNSNGSITRDGGVNNPQAVARNDSARTEATKADMNNSRQGKGSENEIGKAMLFITIMIVVCFMPFLVLFFLKFAKVEIPYSVNSISWLLLRSNGSINAIILVIFSREIRGLAKTLCRR